MTDYNGLIEVCLAEAEQLHNLHNISMNDIILIASCDVAEFMTNKTLIATGGALRSIPYSQYMKGMCYGYETIVVKGDGFFRPVVLYDATIRRLPDKTLLLSRYRYERGEISSGLMRIKGSAGIMEADWTNGCLFYNEDPVQFEDTKPYDNTAIMQFLSGVLNGGESNAD